MRIRKKKKRSARFNCLLYPFARVSLRHSHISHSSRFSRTSTLNTAIFSHMFASLVVLRVPDCHTVSATDAFRAHLASVRRRDANGGPRPASPPKTNIRKLVRSARLFIFPIRRRLILRAILLGSLVGRGLTEHTHTHCRCAFNAQCVM